MQTQFSDMFISHLRKDWRRSSVARNKKAAPVAKTIEQVRQDKINDLVSQLVELSNYEDKAFLANQVKKVLANPMQLRKTDTIPFEINIDNNKVQSEVLQVNELIERVKSMRSARTSQ